MPEKNLLKTIRNAFIGVALIVVVGFIGTLVTTIYQVSALDDEVTELKTEKADKALTSLKIQSCDDKIIGLQGDIDDIKETSDEILTYLLNQ